MQGCPRCGSANPVEARYCMTCGAALTPAATLPEEARKTVTVVFSDVKGFTSLGDTLDAESLRRVMGAYFQRVRGILERHGGTVEKFIGDAVIAVFGVPVLHEDDASRAVRAALEMHASLKQFNDDLQRQLGVSLHARIGVNTGEVVTSASDSDHPLATGAAVILAARLEEAATAGQVLIGPETYKLVRDEVEVAPVALDVKGKADPVEAYRLISASKRPHEFALRFDSPLYFWALQVHPVALLGSLQVLAGYPPTRELVDELVARTGLPREAFQSMYEHAEVDIQHRDEVHELLDTLPITDEQEKLIGVSALHTIDLLGRAFNEIYVRHAAA